jgi:cytochrome c-type biogenesis protein
MRILPKAIAIGLSCGVLGAAAIAWHHGSSTTHSAQVATVAPCGSAAETCGKHLSPNAARAASRLEGLPRLLVFSSHSCPACKRMEPVLAKAVMACNGEREVHRVDLDETAGEALAATYGVSVLPSFVSIDARGVEVVRLSGVQSQQQMEQTIEEIRGVRCASVESPSNEKPL